MLSVTISAHHVHALTFAFNCFIPVFVEEAISYGHSLSSDFTVSFCKFVFQILLEFCSTNERLTNGGKTQHKQCPWEFARHRKGKRKQHPHKKYLYNMQTKRVGIATLATTVSWKSTLSLTQLNLMGYMATTIHIDLD